MDEPKLLRLQEVSVQPTEVSVRVRTYLPASEGQGEHGVPGVGEGAAVGRDGVNAFIEGGRAQPRRLEHPETAARE